MAAELSEERKKALNVAISLVERQHGKGAIMRMGAEGARVKVEAIPTGSIALDAVTSASRGIFSASSQPSDRRRQPASPSESAAVSSSSRRRPSCRRPSGQ